MSFLIFEERKNETGKTKQFVVKNKTEVLGWIRWRNGWRRYVFGTVGSSEYDCNCLKEIYSLALIYLVPLTSKIYENERQ